MRSTHTYTHTHTESAQNRTDPTKPDQTIAREWTMRGIATILKFHSENIISIVMVAFLISDVSF